MEQIKRENFIVELEEPELYVDNEARKRSGHMSHAMAEFAPGCFIDFNANYSADRVFGHMPYGWVEYRISRDSGKTYSEIYDLEYSKQMFFNGIHSISVEKAVATDDGTIVAFCLRNSALELDFCEPWASPTVIRSTDEGKTWSEAETFTHYEGRIYDAVYHNGDIYVMLFCNRNFAGTHPDHIYRLFKSSDNGKTFTHHSTIPFNTFNRTYGSILFTNDGALHAYIYNKENEREMDHAVSYDNGQTWENLKPCYLAKGIRNPQTAEINGVYVLHGRAGSALGFVLYTSTDGINWDEGYMMVEQEDSYGSYYSNNLKLKDEKGEFLLMQYSEHYGGYPDPEGWGRVNVMHRKLRIKQV